MPNWSLSAAVRTLLTAAEPPFSALAYRADENATLQVGFFFVEPEMSARIPKSELSAKPQLSFDLDDIDADGATLVALDVDVEVSAYQCQASLLLAPSAQVTHHQLLDTLATHGVIHWWFLNALFEPQLVLQSRLPETARQSIAQMLAELVARDAMRRIEGGFDLQRALRSVDANPAQHSDSGT